MAIQSGATLLASMRRVYAGWAGSCVRIRRASPAAEQDFGFAAAGVDALVDAAGIASWLAGSDGYVVTVYDQSGNGRNLTNATASTQPRYAADGGNGKPAIWFDTDQKLLASGVSYSTILGAAGYTTASVWRTTSVSMNTSAWSNHAIWEDSAGYVGEMLKLAGGTTPNAYHYVYTGTNEAGQTIALNTTYCGICRANTTNKWYRATASEVTASGGRTGAGGSIGMGKVYSAAKAMVGYVQELVFWASELDATQRGDVRTDQEGFWGSSGATSVTAGAYGQATASGSTSLKTGVRLTGAALATASGSATPRIELALSAVAVGLSSGSAGPQLRVALSAAAAAQASAGTSLSLTVQLEGDAAAEAGASGEFWLQIALPAASAAQASGTGDLLLTASLGAAGLAQASATAALHLQAQLEAHGSAQASGSAGVVIRVWRMGVSPGYAAEPAPRSWSAIAQPRAWDAVAPAREWAALAVPRSYEVVAANRLWEARA